MKHIISTCIVLLCASYMYGEETSAPSEVLSAKEVTETTTLPLEDVDQHCLATNTFFMADAKAKQLSIEKISTLQDQINAYTVQQTTPEERHMMYKNNTLFAIQQSIKFLHEATNCLVEIAYQPFERLPGADRKATLLGIADLQTRSFIWRQVAIALILTAQQDSLVNKTGYHYTYKELLDYAWDIKINPPVYE